MTGDELAARLFAEQGYFVAGSEIPREIGSTPPWNRNQFLPINTPCRIVGEATEAEHTAQYSRAVEIFGDQLGGRLRTRYYYRVEAVD